MNSLMMHNVKSVKITEIACREMDRKPYYTRDIEIRDASGNKLCITLFTQDGVNEATSLAVIL